MEEITVTFFSQIFIHDIWNLTKRDFQKQIKLGKYYYKSL